jgi:hypothetical protein
VAKRRTAAEERARVTRYRRAHWTDQIGDIGDALKERLGVDTDDHRDRDGQRLWQAAHPWFHPERATARRRGRPTEALFNACVLATTDLVRRLQGGRRNDWHTVTLALIAPGGWGPRGFNTPFGSHSREPFALDRTPERIRRDVDQLCERIEEAYRRTMRRRRN